MSYDSNLIRTTETSFEIGDLKLESVGETLVVTFPGGGTLTLSATSSNPGFEVNSVSTTPPISPQAGETYAVKVGATGAWTGHDGELATYTGAAWTFAAAGGGWNAWAIDEQKEYSKDSTSGDWVVSVSSNLVRALVAAASDSNVYTDTEKAKLATIENGATADQTTEEIQDAAWSVLGGTQTGITVTYDDANGEVDFVVASQTDENFTTAEKNKLANIEADATGDMTQGEIQDFAFGGSLLTGTQSGITVAYNSGSNTLDFTVASQTDENFTTALLAKLNAIEAGATADQTASEILTAIKTVDGAGSGLDADTLDGVQLAALAQLAAVQNTFTGNIVIDGDLTVSGTTTTVNTTDLSIGDNIITLNADHVGVPSLDAGVSIERGTETDATFLWKEDSDRWQAYGGLEVLGAIETAVDPTSGDHVGNRDYNDARYALLSGATFTGPIVTSSTVDGRDLSMDGAKLDLIDQPNLVYLDEDYVPTANIKLNDGVTLTLGTDDDWVVTFDNTDGDLEFTSGTNNSAIKFIGQISGSPENVALFDPATGVSLYYQGTKTFETTSSGVAITGNVTVTGTVAGRDIAVDGTKLDGIESGATADQTASEVQDLVFAGGGVFTGATLVGIQTSYAANKLNLTVESQTDNNFTDTLKTKLDGIESAATRDQSASEILTLLLGVDGPGSLLNADFLDNLDSTSFVRTDADSDIPSNKITFGSDHREYFTFAGTTQGVGSQPSYVYLRTDQAFDIFVGGTHTDVSGDSGGGSVLLHLDNTGDVFQFKGEDVWHTGNDGPGSGLNADTVDGIEGTAIVQTSRVLTAGAGLTGGGDLSSDRSFSLDIAGLSDTATASGDWIIFGDADDSVNPKKRTASDFLEDFNVAIRTAADQTFTGNLTIGGDLTISGALVTTATNEVNLGDGVIILLSEVTGTPSEDAGLEVERGTSTNATLLWREGSDTWEASNGLNVLGTLSVSSDPTAGNQVGDRDYNDARYISSTGATVTGDLAFTSTNGTIFGTDKFKVNHDGTQGLIEIIEEGENILLQGNAIGGGTKSMALFRPEGAVDLFYDGTKVFETTATGATVTGNISVTGTVDGRDVAIDGLKLDGIEASANNYILPSEVPMTDEQETWTNHQRIADDIYLFFGDTTGGQIRYDQSGNEFEIFATAPGAPIYIIGRDVGDTQDNTILRADPDTSVDLYYAGVKKFETTAAGATISGNLGVVDITATGAVSANSLSSTTSISGTSLVISGSTATVNGNQVLTVADEGSGNGIDADTVDGIEGSSIVQTSRTISTTGGLTGGGDLSGNRTIYIDLGTIGASTAVVGSDLIYFADASNANASQARTLANVISDLNILTTADEGHGNGIDADTLDTLEATSFVRTDDDSTIPTNDISFGTQLRQMFNLPGGGGIGAQENTTYVRTDKRFSVFDGGVHSDTENAPGSGGAVLFTVTSTDILHGSTKIWTAGNDGTGSGLDADTVDGLHAASFAPASVTISTDTGLTGGGTIASNRTIALDIDALATKPTVVGTDYILLNTSGTHFKTTITDLLTDLNIISQDTGGLDLTEDQFLRSDVDDVMEARLDFSDTATDGVLQMLSGDDSTGSNDYIQMVFGQGGNYIRRHSIRTHHDSAAPAGNGFVFYVWDQTTDADGTIGTQQILKLGATLADFDIPITTSGLLTADNLAIVTGSTATINGNRILTVADEGTGNGLDADTLDSLHATSFVKTDADSVINGSYKLGFDSTDRQMIDLYSTTHGIGTQTNTAYVRTDERFSVFAGGTHNASENNSGGGTVLFTVKNTGDIIEYKGNTVWHAGNDGASSTLDADLLDGIEGASYLRSDAADTFSQKITGGLVSTDAIFELRSGDDTTGSNAYVQQAFGNNNTTNYRHNIRTRHNNSAQANNAVDFYVWDQGTDADAAIGTLKVLSIDGSGSEFHTGGLTVTGLFSATDVNSTVNGSRILTVADEGTGNGIDADLLDGVEGASYLRSDQADSFTAKITGELSSTDGAFEVGSGDIFSGANNYVQIAFSREPGNSNYRHNIRTRHIGNSQADNAIDFYVWKYGTDSVGTIGTEKVFSIDATGSTIDIGGLDITGGLTVDDNFVVTGSTATVNGSQILTVADEGSGNGIDADTVDGLEATSFVRTDADSVITGSYKLGFASTNRQMVDLYGTTHGLGTQTNTAYVRTDERFSIFAGGTHSSSENDANGGTVLFTVKDTGDVIEYKGNTVWHAGNDGASSGLNADTVDSIEASQFLRSDADDFTTSRLGVGNSSLVDHTGTTLDTLVVGDGSGNEGVLVYSGSAGVGGYIFDHELSGDYSGLVMYWSADPDEMRLVIDGTIIETMTTTEATFFGSTNIDSSGNLSLPKQIDLRFETGDGAAGAGPTWWMYGDDNATPQVNFSIDGTGGTEFSFQADGITHTTAALYIGGAKALTTADEGSGNGIDADTLDSLHATSFVRTDATSEIAATYTLDFSDDTQTKIQLYSTTHSLGVQTNTLYARTPKRFSIFSDGVHDDAENNAGAGGAVLFTVDQDTNAIEFQGNTVWHAGNDGPSSGLNADQVDGVELAGLVQIGRTLTAGNGLSGGGDLSDDRSFALDFNELNDVQSTTSDIIAFGDATDSYTIKKRTWANVISDLEIMTLGAASQTMTGDVVIQGNLTVSGTTTTVDTATLDVSDNIITVNSDVTGTPSENGGLEVERGTSTNANILWNETGDFWTVDQGSGSSIRIATVQDSPDSTGVAYWDGSKFVTDSAFTYASSTLTAPTFQAGDGSAGSPSISFTNDPDTGFYSSAGNQLAFATNSAVRFYFGASQIQGATTGSASVLNEAASSTNPTLAPNESDVTTGIGAQAAGNISLIAGGEEIARVDADGFSVIEDEFVVGAASQTALHASGGHFLAGVTPLWEFNDETSDGSGAYAQGIVIRGAVPTGDAVDRELGIHFALSTEGTSGDSDKSGGIRYSSGSVWANGGQLTFYTRDGDVLSVTADGHITAQATDYETLVDNDDAIPNKKFCDDTYVNVSGDTMTGALTLPDGSAAAPSLKWSGDADSGLYKDTDIIGFSIDGAQAFSLSSTAISGSDSNAASVLNEAASATNPTLVPDKADLTTGIGGASGTPYMSMIVGGTEVGRWSSSGLTITGHLAATTKSFEIDHPSDPNKKLIHGVLEGPEHAVYVRGRIPEDGVIILPDYWKDLVHEDSITVQTTPLGEHQDLYVDDLDVTHVCIRRKQCGSIRGFYYIQATRKDVPELEVEVDR